ncbi:ATP-binding protein [Pedobacter psychrodurus]|uniref:HD domain-containing protein n=1 Tax=Pedobacter psychrodurus TaxID=2530456 RepID=UPI002930BC21|nr:ATP-binding protein [Pedobacter psychrodurus]
MLYISLPKRFENKLSEDQHINGLVNTALSTFGQILSDNKLYFFEEYTDHGKEHIEDVIAAADHLISEDDFKLIIKVDDVAYFILSVVLHDIGMHIRPEGLVKLLSGEFESVRVKKLDARSWSQEWEDFLGEARRFDQKQLLAIFGDPDHIVNVPDIYNPDSLTGHDRKLVGEFIRRQHPRLAHEIALAGFPGHELLPFCPELGERNRSLIGLIARSHGTDLRVCADYLEDIFTIRGKTLPLGVHAIFLMVLLRISDYLQIDSSRTSIKLLKLRRLSSPVSETEHQAHLSIDYIDDRYQQDPERIFVTASPKDSSMFFKLKKLFAGIQHELDLSLAVLGELYGNLPNSPGIRFRRIQSNLDDPSFIDRLNYVPEVLSFKANDELTRLLIAPLYGNDPTYGVRELLQNAVDACRERKFISDDDYVPEVKIDVSMEGTNCFFTIEDNGMGMDAGIISNYFLKAGASFRNSGEWKKQYSSLNGTTNIRRNGRFGIGVLAAFLLGAEIEVRTRRLGNDTGFRFDATIDAQQIELLKDDTLEVGTVISIKIARDVFAKFSPTAKGRSYLRWTEWYTLVFPKVTYSFDGKTIVRGSLNPDIGGVIPEDWNMLEVDGYNALLWTYEGRAHDAKFSCNGIVIPHDPAYTGLKVGLFQHLPKIQLFDSEGNLPISLSRNSFTGKLPFSQELEEDISRDFVAYLLTVPIESTITDDELILSSQLFRYPGLSVKNSADTFGFGRLSYESASGLLLPKAPLLSKEGFILDYPYFVNRLKRRKALFINGKVRKNKFSEIDIKDYFIKYSSGDFTTIPEYKSLIEPKEHSNFHAPALFVFESGTYEYLFSKDFRRLNLSVRNAGEKVPINEKWVGVNFRLGRESVLSKGFLAKVLGSVKMLRDYDLRCAGEGHPVLNAVLKKYFGDDVVIPFLLEDRKAKYPLAFEELKPYMAKYLKQLDIFG